MRRPLVAACAAAAASLLLDPSAAPAQAPPRAVSEASSALPAGPLPLAPLDGQVFPVARDARRWMNWRDTYGAPRMRLEDDGVWRQAGVHQGIDIYAEKGATVVSVGRGTVEQVGWTFYSGWRVGVRGADGRYYFYAHLSSFAPGIVRGAAVEPGTPLGGVGSSGYGPEGTADEFAPHLHFGIQSSRWENPKGLLEALWEHSVTRTDAARWELKALRRQKRLVAARAFSAAPPPGPALLRRMEELRSSVERASQEAAGAPRAL